ncbi:MAG: helix-turn-helix transcriptional regulator [Tissierellaceae bacterium]
MAREQLQNLTEPMYYILLALTEERHGYEVMQIIEEMTGARVLVGPGTLYALLARFEAEKIISQVSKEGRRKNYLITAEGRELLDRELARLRSLIEDGERILLGKEGTIRDQKPDRVKAHGKANKKEEGNKKPDKERKAFRRKKDENILW